jgi:hypothetical protein
VQPLSVQKSVEMAFNMRCSGEDDESQNTEEFQIKQLLGAQERKQPRIFECFLPFRVKSSDVKTKSGNDSNPVANASSPESSSSSSNSSSPSDSSSSSSSSGSSSNSSSTKSTPNDSSIDGTSGAANSHFNLPEISLQEICEHGLDVKNCRFYDGTIDQIIDQEGLAGWTSAIPHPDFSDEFGTIPMGSAVRSLAANFDLKNGQGPFHKLEDRLIKSMQYSFQGPAGLLKKKLDGSAAQPHDPVFKTTTFEGRKIRREKKKLGYLVSQRNMGEKSLKKRGFQGDSGVNLEDSNSKLDKTEGSGDVSSVGDSSPGSSSVGDPSKAGNSSAGDSSGADAVAGNANGNLNPSVLVSSEMVRRSALIFRCYYKLHV